MPSRAIELQESRDAYPRETLYADVHSQVDLLLKEGLSVTAERGKTLVAQWRSHPPLDSYIQMSVIKTQTESR